MATQIEVLKENDTQTKVAYYFRIPAGSIEAGAIRPNKIPQGVSLEAQERADFKVGAIHQLIVKYPFADLQSKNPNQQRNFLEAEWLRLEVGAVDDYVKEFSLLGDYFDGVDWNEAG